MYPTKIIQKIFVLLIAFVIALVKLECSKSPIMLMSMNIMGSVAADSFEKIESTKKITVAACRDFELFLLSFKKNTSVNNERIVHTASTLPTIDTTGSACCGALAKTAAAKAEATHAVRGLNACSSCSPRT